MKDEQQLSVDLEEAFERLASLSDDALDQQRIQARDETLRALGYMVSLQNHTVRRLLAARGISVKTMFQLTEHEE